MHVRATLYRSCLRKRRQALAGRAGLHARLALNRTTEKTKKTEHMHANQHAIKTACWSRLAASRCTKTRRGLKSWHRGRARLSAPRPQTLAQAAARRGSALRDLNPQHGRQRVQAGGVALHGDQARAGGQAAGQARSCGLQLPRVLALQRQHQPRAVRLAAHLRGRTGAFRFIFRF